MRNLITAITIISVIAACSGPKSSSKEEIDTTEFEASKTEVEEKLGELVYDIPSPADVPFLLQQTGADFMPDLLNDLENVDQYVATNHKSSINLGVLSTDIGYLIAYDKTQQALQYINETSKLADKLGLNTTYTVEMLQRFEQNLSSKDSLAAIINEAINSSEEFLDEMDRLELSVKIVSGSFIEGLYISTQIIKNYPDILTQEQKDLIMTRLMAVIVEQQEPLEKLAQLCSTFEQDEDISQLYADLNWLIADFEALNLKEKLDNNEGGLVLRENMLSSITSHLEEIRQRMIE